MIPVLKDVLRSSRAHACRWAHGLVTVAAARRGAAARSDQTAEAPTIVAGFYPACLGRRAGRDGPVRASSTSRRRAPSPTISSSRRATFETVCGRRPRRLRRRRLPAGSEDAVGAARRPVARRPSGGGERSARLARPGAVRAGRCTTSGAPSVVRRAARQARATLAALDAQYRRGLGALSPARTFVTTHAAFGHLAQSATGSRSCRSPGRTPEAEPGPQELERLVAACRGVGCARRCSRSRSSPTRLAADRRARGRRRRSPARPDRGAELGAARRRRGLPLGHARNLAALRKALGCR